jgi:hypothetical protein
MPANSVKQHSPANFYNMAPQIGIFAQFRRSTMDNANKLAELNVKAWKMAIEDASTCNQGGKRISGEETE